MVNLIELKRLATTGEQPTNLTSVEKIVLAYLQGEGDSKELVKKIPLSELDHSLTHYVDEVTLPLWLNVLSVKTLPLFLQLKNSDITTYLKDWLREQKDLHELPCEVNLASWHCKLKDSNLTKIFTELNLPVDCSEVEPFVSSLKLLEESPNQYFTAQLIYLNHGYKLVLGEGENQEANRINWWQQNLVKPVQIAVVCMALFGAVEAQADDQSGAALNAAKNAALSTEQGKQIKETVDQLQKRVTKAAEKMVKETGTQIPVTVVGYGVKAAIDQKVEIKNTSLNSLGLAMDANMAIGFDGTMNLGVGGKTPFLDNGKYKLEGTTGSGKQSIEMKLNFEF
jgi:hypothetical protein